jgi:transposase InsO family protein
MEEVAYQLMDIFCVFGAPFILYSDNGREFVNKIMKSLAEMWPGMKLVHGKPRHSQSQGSVEPVAGCLDVRQQHESVV